MALYPHGKELIWSNLETIQKGQKAPTVAIGVLTPKQHADINAIKQAQGLPLLENPEIVLIGQHIYNSRVIRDGYSIEDVVMQIEGALAITSGAIVTHKMTAIRSTSRRQDGYGNAVLDEAVFELTRRKPRAELFSVVPKGDYRKPADVKLTGTEA